MMTKLDWTINIEFKGRQLPTWGRCRGGAALWEGKLPRSAVLQGC